MLPDVPPAPVIVEVDGAVSLPHEPPQAKARISSEIDQPRRSSRSIGRLQRDLELGEARGEIALEEAQRHDGVALLRASLMDKEADDRT
jgi:hypothetical protein